MIDVIKNSELNVIYSVYDVIRVPSVKISIIVVKTLKSSCDHTDAVAVMSKTVGEMPRIVVLFS